MKLWPFEVLNIMVAILRKWPWMILCVILHILLSNGDSKFISKFVHGNKLDMLAYVVNHTLCQYHLHAKHWHVAA